VEELEVLGLGARYFRRTQETKKRGDTRTRNSIGRFQDLFLTFEKIVVQYS
jgi:hypothetical protein